jgi:hypothetical protein
MAANANSNPPKKNQEFTFAVMLEDCANPGSIKLAPTLAAGDFKISKDGGAFANLDTTPSANPASSGRVEVYATATEMNANNVVFRWIDQTTPKEWCDGSVCILTTA